MAELVLKKAAQIHLAPLFIFLSMVTAVLLMSSCQTNDPGLFESSCVEGNCVHPLDVLNSIKLSRVNYVMQVDQKGCGAATLSSVLTYWDKPISYKRIVSKYPPASEDGYSVGELKFIASKHDLAAFSLKMSEKTLKDNLAKGRPVIVAIKKYIFKYTNLLPDFVPFKDTVTFSHFLVIFGFNERGYWVMDPAEGYMYLATEVFVEMWERQRFVGILISSKPSQSPNS